MIRNNQGHVENSKRGRKNLISRANSEPNINTAETDSDHSDSSISDRSGYSSLRFSHFSPIVGPSVPPSVSSSSLPPIDRPHSVEDSIFLSLGGDAHLIESAKPYINAIVDRVLKNSAIYSNLSVESKESIIQSGRLNTAVITSSVHMLSEASELVTWTPMGAEEDAKNAPHRIIHYGTSFQTMVQTGLKTHILKTDSSNDEFVYFKNKLIHISALNSLNIEKSKSKVLSAIHKKNKPLSLDVLSGSSVVIPICYASDEHLTGKSLQNLIKEYASLGVKKITLYFGRNDSYEIIPLKRPKNVSKNTLEAWNKENPWACNSKGKADFLSENKLQDITLEILTREELIKTPNYLRANKLVLEILLPDHVIQGAVERDVTVFLTQQIKQLPLVRTNNPLQLTPPLLSAASSSSPSSLAESSASSMMFSREKLVSPEIPGSNLSSRDFLPREIYDRIAIDPQAAINFGLLFYAAREGRFPMGIGHPQENSHSSMSLLHALKSTHTPSQEKALSGSIESSSNSSAAHFSQQPEKKSFFKTLRDFFSYKSEPELSKPESPPKKPVKNEVKDEAKALSSPPMRGFI